jgi:hypothetical protein
MKITLTPDIEKALTKLARSRGMTPEILALNTLREQFVYSGTAEVPVSEEETLADFLADHLGVIASSEKIPGGARMSEDTGKKFAAGLAKKRQQGRL